MSADILMFDSTHVPVGSDQIQHLEMTRDIAQRFNHLYKPILTIPEPMIQDSENTVPGLDGKKMSKSYNNVIPLLGSEKELRKSVMKIVTNSLEPGEPKDINDCTVFALYEYFASEGQIDDLKKSYIDGISWGDAKEILFKLINEELNPIRTKFEELRNNNDYLYANIFFFVDVEHPSGLHRTDTLQYILAAPDGKWLGSGVGEIKYNLLKFKENETMQSGLYKYKIIHGMRDDILIGVEDNTEFKISGFSHNAFAKSVFIRPGAIEFALIFL